MRSRRAWRPILFAVGFGGAAVVIGMQWGDAVLLGLVAAAVALAGSSPDTGRSPPWPPERAEETHGARRDVSALTWSFLGRDGQVTETAVRRLRKDATQRLARRGVVVPGGLSSATPTRASEEVRERARDLLGERTWATLTAPGGLMPSLGEIAHCVDVIERLATNRPVPPAPRGEQ